MRPTRVLQLYVAQPQPTYLLLRTKSAGDRIRRVGTSRPVSIGSCYHASDKKNDGPITSPSAYSCSRGPKWGLVKLPSKTDVAFKACISRRFSDEADKSCYLGRDDRQYIAERSLSKLISSSPISTLGELCHGHIASSGFVLLVMLDNCRSPNIFLSWESPYTSLEVPL